MGAYQLSRSTHVCLTDGMAVLLDLRADRYLGLDREQTRALAGIVQGWPVAARDADAVEAKALADALVRRGVLTKHVLWGKAAALVVLPRIERSLVQWDGADWKAICARDVIRFACAYLRARLALRLRSLEGIVVGVQRRKARQESAAADLEKVSARVRCFRTLRPLFYSARDQCLLDSLVLTKFLSQHRIYATLVIGVKASPFAAHSWVQADEHVLNGAAAYTRGFTPIVAA